MKRRKRDAELIDVILSDCETLTKRIDHFGSTESSFVCDRSEEGALFTESLRMPSIFLMKSNQLFRSIPGMILGVFATS